MTDFANSKMITNRDSNFGLSFKKSKQIYFKEYEIELFGKESPGPAVYSPNMTFFKKEKHDAKSFTMVTYNFPLNFIFLVKTRVSTGAQGGAVEDGSKSNELQPLK